MPKTAKKQAPSSAHNEFELLPTNNDLYFKQPVSLSFCKAKEDPKCKTTSKRQKVCKSGCLCSPIFNKDNNYATSAFILPEQKKNYIENGMKFRLEHDCRIREYNDQKTQMLVPKPKSKQQYCNVCRINYQDYLDHIKSYSHKNNIGKSHFTKFIKQLQDKYDKINHGRNSQPKNCFSTDTTQNGSQSEPQPQLLGLPTKKIKRDFSYTPTICIPVKIDPVGGFGQIPAVTQLSPFSNIAQPNERHSFPVSYFNCQLGPQMQTFQNISNQIYPFITTPSIPCGQMGTNYTIDSNIFMRLPIIFCNSFQNINQIPSTYYNFPLQPQPQDMENYII